VKHKAIACLVFCGRPGKSSRIAKQFPQDCVSPWKTRHLRIHWRVVLRHTFVGLLLLFITIGAFAGTTTIQPTTTLAAETGNNTSAANSFAGTSNGNAAATNISKLPIRSLLYAGSTTKIYAHLMPWFGPSNHMSVGYDSSDPAQAARQVADMNSRGIDGVIVDWYGPNSTQHNTSTKNVLKYSEQYPNFRFVICEDYGAVSGSTNPTQQTISDLNYAWQTFMQSPAYLKSGGRPVIMFFGFEGKPVDVAAVKTALTFNPIFIFRNSGGFTKAQSDGSFAWLAPLTSGYDNYMSLPYADDFYSTAVSFPSQMGFGSGFKGFNDTLASWAPPGGRHINQYCGSTWMTSLAEAGKYYSATNQLPALQVVTWNDYEEGTAIEPGIDNCVAITAWMSGSTLNWSITGDEKTLDHYTVFASTDGVNLMSVGDYATGNSSADLGAMGFAQGTYQFYVKAVAKASMLNHMSSSVSYSVTAPTPSAPADYSLDLAPLAITVAQGGAASVTVGVNPVNSAFNSAVTFSCSNLPANLTCNFSKTSVVPGATGATTTLTLKSTTATASDRHSFAWTMLPAFGFLFTLGADGRRRAKLIASLACMLVIVSLAVGCGGGTASNASKASAATKAASYTVTIAATSGSIVRTTTASVTIQ
jgi:hypothetical protein